MNSSGFKGQARQGFNGRGGRRGRETPTQNRSRWQQRRNSGSSQSQGPSTPTASTAPVLPFNNVGGDLSDLLAGFKDRQAFVHVNNREVVKGKLVSYDISGPSGLRFELALGGDSSTVRAFGPNDFESLRFETDSALPVVLGGTTTAGTQDASSTGTFSPRLTPPAAPVSAPTGPAALASAPPTTQSAPPPGSVPSAPATPTAPTGPAGLPLSAPTGPSGSFRTDAAISGAGKVVERKLERWQDDGDEAAAAADSLATDLGALDTMAHDGEWDQFAANKQRFGIETTYDERFYTTEIDESHPDYQERRRRAERLAKDIMRDSAGNANVHIAEERGLQVDDSGLDEEDKYSGVDRRGSTDFVAKEARAAEANQRYYDRERADRRQDMAQFNRDFNLGVNVQPPHPQHPMMMPPMATPPVGMPGSSGPGTPQPTSASPSSATSTLPKRAPKTFDFASAAKASFKPVSSVKPPSQSGSPLAPGTPISIPIPGRESASVSQSPPPAKLRSLKGAFDYFARFEVSGEQPPKPFTTLVSWDSHSGPSYKDQFTAAVPAPVPVPVMPYGYYPGYAAPPMFVYDK